VAERRKLEQYDHVCGEVGLPFRKKEKGLYRIARFPGCGGGRRGRSQEDARSSIKQKKKVPRKSMKKRDPSEFPRKERSKGHKKNPAAQHQRKNSP